MRIRNRRVLDSDVRIVNPVQRKFFGFGPIDVLGYTVMMIEQEKTVVEFIDRPDLPSGEGEAAVNVVELLWVKKRIAPHAQDQSD